MNKKICPVCDQVMKRKHYCMVCRQWVSNPRIQKTNYYLNERHPLKEEDCDYHTPIVKKAPSSGAGGIRMKMNQGKAEIIRKSSQASGNKKVVFSIMLCIVLIKLFFEIIFDIIF